MREDETQGLQATVLCFAVLAVGLCCVLRTAILRARTRSYGRVKGCAHSRTFDIPWIDNPCSVVEECAGAKVLKTGQDPVRDILPSSVNSQNSEKSQDSWVKKKAVVWRITEQDVYKNPLLYVVVVLWACLTRQALHRVKRRERLVSDNDGVDSREQLHDTFAESVCNFQKSQQRPLS